MTRRKISDAELRKITKHTQRNSYPQLVGPDLLKEEPTLAADLARDLLAARRAMRRAFNLLRDEARSCAQPGASPMPQGPFDAMHCLSRALGAKEPRR